MWTLPERAAAKTLVTAIHGASWSGQVPVSGCTDPFSENYDPNASLDDGSCEYSQEVVTFTKQD